MNQMKKNIRIALAAIVACLFSFVLFSAASAPGVRTASNSAFTYGEKITYKVRYNLYFNVNVGEVSFEIAPNAEKIAGNNCYHVIASGKTYGFYDPVYKVRDKYETYIETSSMLPVVFIRDVQEGKFKFNEYVVFNQSKNLAKSKKRTQTVPEFTQDVVSSIDYARTLDFSNAKIGDKYYMHTFIDDSAYHCGVQYAGKEVIKTDLGSIRCIKLKPILIVDRMFKSQDGMTLWVTDDNNHIPVRIESGISVGKIRADLDSYSGLKNPMTSKN
jgi:hypothetical protein